MNFWKAFCYAIKNPRLYRTTIDAGKAIAPIAQPLVENYLVAHGLPVSGQNALDVLTQAALSKIPLAGVLGGALSDYIGQHIALVAPAPAPVPASPAVAPTIAGNA